VILYISDFDMVSSGYMQLSISLCRELSERGRKVTALGMGYKGDEHNWPFSIIPVRGPETFMFLSAMYQNLIMLSQAGQFEHIEAVVAALDIPYQERIRAIVGQKGLSRPLIGLFPVESGPVCPTWGNILAGLDERLVISRWGLDCLKEAGLTGDFIPIGLDTASWRPPQPHERTALRKALGFDESTLVVLTVADNQERKNLWAGARTIRELAKTNDVYWILVTRLASPAGWIIPDLANSLGIGERLMTYERGLAFERLWMLYATADAFLLPSKAEGFGMPMIEAMACGLPVVATDCTAVTEQIYDDYPTNSVPRGFPIEIEYQHVDPWGNSVRSWASAKSAAEQLRTVAAWKASGDARLASIVERGLAYARSRTWKAAGDVLDAAIERVRVKEAPPPPPVLPGLEPLTIPRPIPIQPEEQP
jgi:glycosyltransferase involved in cell wall biosynthesis